VLTGINLGAWGSKLEPVSTLADLVTELCQLPELERLRISSIEPAHWTPGLVEAVSHPKVCNHWHVPLQSGSTRILRAMHRPYTPSDVLRLFGELCGRSPDCALGTDVIVGFPGEAPEDFEQTLRLLEALPLAYLHVFPFSPRPGTEAACWPNQIPPREAERRAQIVRRLGQAKQHAYEASRIGRRYSALVQRGARARSHESVALTRNYLKVAVRVDANRHNTLQLVRLTGWNEGRLCGELIDSNASASMP
jgi:threonylcarbamoyladenosine tRNA methylthiotransferase MtaB